MLMWPFGNAGGLATLHGELHFQLDLCILAPTPTNWQTEGSLQADGRMGCSFCHVRQMVNPR
jgi:hypothetical protein